MHIINDAESIIKKVFDKNGLAFDMNVIRSKSRRSDHVLMRRIAVAALRNSGYSLSGIGKVLNRHHASIIHLINTEGWDETPDVARIITEKQVIMRKIKYHNTQIKLLEGKL